MNKPRNPRRVTLSELRKIATWVRYMISDWDQDQTIRDVPVRFTDGYGRSQVHHTGRKRRDDEKIENNVEEWRKLIRWMSGVAAQADLIMTYAQEQIDRLETERKDS
jgi:hypothetical protein